METAYRSDSSNASLGRNTQMLAGSDAVARPATIIVTCQREAHLNARCYFLTTTIRGLSFAARLWTTKALPFALALSLRAR